MRRGKLGKARMVVFGHASARELWRHLRRCERSVPLFLGCRGRRITPGTIGDVVRRLGRAAGVEGLHPRPGTSGGCDGSGGIERCVSQPRPPSPTFENVSGHAADRHRPQQREADDEQPEQRRGGRCLRSGGQGGGRRGGRVMGRAGAGGQPDRGGCRRSGQGAGLLHAGPHATHLKPLSSSQVIALPSPAMPCSPASACGQNSPGS